MLGSLSDADDAVQETWLRLSRSDAGDLANLGGWLTMVVSRICLDMLRSRSERHEEPLGEHLPDPVVGSLDRADPEREAELADAVAMALLVVLDKLSPAERLAFVLHDLFAVPFDDIAPIVGRSPNAAAQLASRARRRVRGAAAATDTSLARQREVVGAWIAAARGGDFDALLTLLDPDVVVRIDLDALPAGGLREVRGAAHAVGLAASYRRFAPFAHAALVSGSAGIVVTADGGQPASVMAFTFAAGKITEIYILAGRSRLTGSAWRRWVTVLAGPSDRLPATRSACAIRQPAATRSRPGRRRTRPTSNSAQRQWQSQQPPDPGPRRASMVRTRAPRADH